MILPIFVAGILMLLGILLAATARGEDNNTGSGGETQAPPPAGGGETAEAPPAGAPQGATNNVSRADFVNTILGIHNRERAAVGVPPLVWSDTLAADAQEYADHLAAIGNIEHMWASASKEWSNKAHGANENIAWRGPPGPGTLGPMVESWVNEKQYFDGTLNSKNGHYTEMIWKATKELGCGEATGLFQAQLNGNGDVLVCRYLPSGNTGSDPFK
jgi:uncharacterized protein YkwD